jgi:hypothetical protein
MVEQLLAVDKDQGHVGLQEFGERLDPARCLLGAAGLFREPLARVVVPDETQRVEGVALAALLSPGSVNFSVKE